MRGMTTRPLHALRPEASADFAFGANMRPQALIECLGNPWDSSSLFEDAGRPPRASSKPLAGLLEPPRSRWRASWSLFGFFLELWKALGLIFL